MTVLGTHVGISEWTAVVLVAGVVAVLGAPRLARRFGMRELPTLVAAAALVLVIALTLTPDGPGPARGLAACIPISWADVPVDVAADGGGLAGAALNVALYVPFAAAVVLACERLWPGLALLALPPVVELAQTVLPGRSCALADVLANGGGIVIGSAIGLLVLRRAHRVRSPG